MSQQSIAPLLKKQMIESQTPNGKCYLRVLCTLPSFLECDPSLLEEVIVNMTLWLRSNPKGLDVLHRMWDAEKILRDGIDSGIGLEVSQPEIQEPVPVWFIESIMSAPFRFGFEDRGGVMHVTYYLRDQVNTQNSDTEIETEFGFASRYIFQMMCNQGRHIGATEALDDLFNQFLEEEMGEGIDERYFDTAVLPKVPITPSYPIEHNVQTGLYDKDPVRRETQSRLEDVYNKMEKKRPTSPGNGQSSNRELLERLTRMEERMNSVPSVKETDNVDPDDSSSNIGRYSKKFMNTGTVVGTEHIYNHRKNGTMLAIREENLPLDITKEIAVGYLRTKDIRQMEVSQLKKIAPINGLANPFRSSRLNVLMHFHTAINNVLPRINNGGYLKMMAHMVKYTPRCASEEFAYQLILRTFDMSNLMVLSNPFKLPFIEVGMQITDSTLVKCFSLLEGEYKTLWFNEMKHLNVPNFHDEYSDYSSNAYSKSETKYSSQNISPSHSKKPKDRSAYIRSKSDRSTLSILR